MRGEAAQSGFSGRATASVCVGAVGGRCGPDSLLQVLRESRAVARITIPKEMLTVIVSWFTLPLQILTALKYLQNKINHYVSDYIQSISN